MSVGLILTCIIGVALLILVFASKIMNILVGLISTIGGIAIYFWLYSGEWLKNLQMIYEYKITPEQLRTYSLIAIGVGVVLLLIGVARGGKTKKIIVVEKQVPAEAKKEEKKIEKAKEDKSVEEKKEIKVEAEPKKEIKEDSKVKEESKQEDKKENKKEDKKEEAKAEEKKDNDVNEEQKTANSEDNKTEDSKQEEKDSNKVEEEKK